MNCRAVYTFLVLAAITGCETQQPSVVLTYAFDLTKLDSGYVPDNDELADALNARLGGRASARPIENEQVVVEVYFNPTADQLAAIKRRIGADGNLEFRITAQPNRPEIRSIIDAAMQLPENENNVMVGGAKRAEWVAYAPEEFGDLNMPDDRIVKRVSGATPQALVLVDAWNVTGEYLTSATRGFDERGGPAINFTLNTAGAGRFRQLTSENLPNQASGTYRHLGIILDKRMLSAPRIHSTISDRGQISGGAMSVEEVESIVGILNSGRLPSPIKLVREVRMPGGGASAAFVSPIVAVLGAGILLLVLIASSVLAFKLR
jgi:preprotein translocase subunit SecD